MSLESPQDVVRKRLLELNIRPYGDLKRSVWDVTWRTLWGNPQDIIFQRPKDVGRRPPMALHRGPYGGHLLGTSSGRPQNVILPSG